VAIGGWSAGQLHRLLGRYDVVRQLKNYGARVHWDCHLVRNGEIYYVTDVHINSPRFPDEGLALLPRLSKLKAVHLHGPRFTDASLDYIVPATDLRYLILQNTRITQEGLGRLKAQRPDLEFMLATPIPPAPTKE
jgi:hypothetical protein